MFAHLLVSALPDAVDAVPDPEQILLIVLSFLLPNLDQ